MSARIWEKPKRSGKWYVVVNHDGQRKTAIAEDKRTAEATCRLINRKILEGTFSLDIDDDVRTVQEYGEIFLHNCALKPSTQSDYASLLRVHINPDMGAKRVDKITRLDIKTFLKKKLAEGLSLSTITHLKATLNNLFNVAFDDAAIQQNPAARLGRITGRGQESHTTGVKPIFLGKDQLSLLLATFADQRPEHYDLALTLARTGMRSGEAVALQWNDIDFDHHTITVSRSKSRTIIDTPKSGKSREVDMSPQLASVLWQRWKEAKEEAIKTRRVPKWIFPGKKSETIDMTAWRRRTFDKIVEEAGLPHMRVHDLRHTYASLMIQQGQPLIYIQRQLGHHSIQITADTYGHLLRSADRSAVAGLDDIMHTKFDQK